MAVAAIRPKEFHFPVSTHWVGERRVAVSVEGKQTVEITPPLEFRGTDPTTWSPEDLFVASAASCLAVTYTGLASRAGLAYSSLDVDGDGIAGTRSDRRFGFTSIDLFLTVAVEPGDEARAREVADQAEKSCLVAASLDLPVDVSIDVRTTPLGQ